ncbi:MAG: hypothetical protein ACRD0K_22710 [Egibacteraceae bacterium]
MPMALLMLSLGPALLYPFYDRAAPPGFLTILLGRTQVGWCDASIDTVPAESVLAELGRRGHVATGSVVLGRTDDTQDTCFRSLRYPSWATLVSWRHKYGFEAVSAGNYQIMTQLTVEQQRAESCGSLPTFAQHGFERAWGLFAYPGNQLTPQIQADVVSTCFAYGRRYGARINQRAELAAPWFAYARDIVGGACNDEASSCFTVVSDRRPASSGAMASARRYTSPDEIVSMARVAADEWRIVQFYRFVFGKRLSGVPRWDCTSHDWRQHWTTLPEDYCWSDVLTALDRIPAGTVATDPATVAQAWGRLP